MNTAPNANRRTGHNLPMAGGPAAWAFVIVTILSALACDQKKPSGEKQAQVVASSAETLEKEKAAQEKAAAEAAQRAEEEAKAAALSREEKMKACCVSLAKKGFEGRSMEYMSASRLCKTAQEEGKAVTDLTQILEKELGDEPLPEQCR